MHLTGWGCSLPLYDNAAHCPNHPQPCDHGRALLKRMRDGMGFTQAVQSWDLPHTGASKISLSKGGVTRAVSFVRGSVVYDGV